MKQVLKYANKNIIIEPITTLIEKDLLILTLTSNCTLDDALLTCGYDFNTVESLTRREKIAILFKIRSVSLGDEIEIKYTCKHCRKSSDTSINIDNIMVINEDYEPDENINDIFIDLNRSNLNLFVNTDIDDLDFDEFEVLYEKVKNHIVTFNFEKTYDCKYCGEKNSMNFEFMDDKSIIDYMSNKSAQEIYKDYNTFIFYTKYSKLDVDSMIPFEREILTGLLKNTIEEQKNKN